jgi:mxaJ protein
MGVPANFERVIPTRPYYRSTYCFVYRNSAPAQIRSFDDPALRQLKIGVPLVGGSNNSPPAQWLSDRNIVDNIVGYSIYTDYREANPASRMIEAVTRGDIDLAVAWGPVAGYFARKQSPPLTVVSITQTTNSSTPIAYDICIGVRRSNPQLRRQIDDVLIRRKLEIDRILDDYGVPRVPPNEPATPSRIHDEKLSH